MRGYAAIGLTNPKNSINVGSVLRAARCYDVAMVVISGDRPRRFLGRIPTDTHKTWRHIPLMTAENLHDVIPYDCVPVAVDLIDGATSLVDYKHPERAFYIFGPEDGTLGKAVTDWCRDTIYVPTTLCMNLAATANVILYDRLAKSLSTGDTGS